MLVASSYRDVCVVVVLVVVVVCTSPRLVFQAMAYRGLSRHVDLEACPEPGDRFALQELIGEGTYGEVYSARDSVTGEFCGNDG